MKKWLLFTLGCLFSILCFADPLPVSEIFQVNATKVDPNQFLVKWTIKPGYFLYSDRININVPDDSNIQLGPLSLPPALTKKDLQGKAYTVYRNELSLPIAVLGKEPGEALVTLHYQGCADDGFCYPPQTKQIKLAIAKDLSLSNVELFQDNTVMSEESANTTTDEPTLDSIFLNHNLPMIFLIFFGFGLLLSFTPCILPMVPVLSGIIVGHSQTMSTGKAFRLSLSYVLSMSVTYALVGAAVSLLGSNLQIIMQSPWAISLFSLLFVILSLSMFGFFELKLPVSWQAKLAQLNRRQESGHYLSAAVMGCLSTLILSPCVTAPLIGVLGYIASSGNVVLGSFSLFFLSLGMGTPLILIGTSAGRWLPKAGHWMNAVKSFFGVLLLGVAIYLLSRILPGALSMACWAALLIFSGIYLGALVRATSNYDKFCQGMGIILLVYGLFVLLGASMGETNPLQPLAHWSDKEHETLAYQPVKTVAEVEQAIASAQGKPVILDFYADWCVTCQYIEANVLKNPEVKTRLKDFVVLRADVTANNEANQALLRKYQVVAPPTFLFFNKEGDELEHSRLVGEVDSQMFLKRLQSVKSQAF
ncbi:thiol:disulfide interchange protein DsbD [Legionella beliardensis]|uniref:Thiol:disulfide interchange protein DsbD n=1 Tax=Legionella beliardensis TaxID=91822 RepID=A0A378I4C0_9GAMM|nr:protein-disulfide reductase DsbD [Legionella beliardensis]STX29531.1 thiol:disulfide interchange protein DsbD [Legionella beliardensis]